MLFTDSSARSSGALEVLRAESIAVSYGEQRVLTSATLRAEAGVVTALLGSNGSGKSTLLRVASGILLPRNGVVHFKGIPCLHPRLPALARRGLFFMPDRDLLSASLSIEQQFQLVARTTGHRVDPGVLALAAPDDIWRRHSWQLSGGERRLVELALAWLRAPDCLLADEPLRSMAPLELESALALLGRLADRGCAVVLTGHELTPIFSAADRVVWCTSGTTYELGPPTDALRNTEFRRSYLGPASDP